MVFLDIRWFSIVYLLICTNVLHSHDVFNMLSDVNDDLPVKSDSHREKVNDEARRYVNIPAKNTPSSGVKESYLTEYQTVLIAYRQFVQEWLKKFPSHHAQHYRFLVDISSKQLDRLKQFASSTTINTESALSEVHSVTDLLKRMIESIEEEMPMDGGLTWSAWIRSFDINNIAKMTIVTTAVGLITFVSVQSHLRKGRWMTALLIVAFIMSFLQNWYALYLDAQAQIDEVRMKKLPKHCMGQPKSFLDSLKEKVTGYISLPSNECREHYRAALGGAHLQATPIQALSMTFAQLFLTPLGAVGEGLSKFFGATMLHVPGVLWPVIILIIAVVFVLIVLICSKDEISGFYGLFSARSTPRPAISVAATVVEQLESSSNSADRVKALEDQVRELQKQLADRPVLALENKAQVKEEVKDMEETIETKPIIPDSPGRSEPPSSPPPPGFRSDLVPQ